MIQVLKTLPKDLYVAFSGGIDSVACTHYLMRKHNVHLIHFMHDLSDTAQEEEEFVTKFAAKYNTTLFVEVQSNDKSPNESKEVYWRNGRQEFYKRFTDHPVVTCHHLNDAVEWYLMTCLRGEGHFMEYESLSTIKPFLCTPKESIIEYADDHQLEWYDDLSNYNPNFALRNLIRKELLPTAMLANPGLMTVVRKKITEKMQKKYNI